MPYSESFVFSARTFLDGINGGATILVSSGYVIGIWSSLLV